MPIPIAQSALLVVDVQDTFKFLPRWERRNNPGFERNVARLVDAYRDAGLPVVFVIHSQNDGGPFARTSPHYKLMDFLVRRDGETLVEKTSHNSFTSTSLQSWLDERRIGRVVVTGIQTEMCCETTARVASDLGYDVDFVTEATLTFPIVNEVNGETRELSAEAVVERTEFALRNRFARIATVDDVVAELRGASAACANG
jgi:nicotinamidase-related amidase